MIIYLFYISFQYTLYLFGLHRMRKRKKRPTLLYIGLFDCVRNRFEFSSCTQFLGSGSKRKQKMRIHPLEGEDGRGNFTKPLYQRRSCFLSLPTYHPPTKTTPDHPSTPAHAEQSHQMKSHILYTFKF